MIDYILYCWLGTTVIADIIELLGLCLGLVKQGRYITYNSDIGYALVHAFIYIYVPIYNIYKAYIFTKLVIKS